MPLSTPHHDGSALYVSSLHPDLGDQVHVRLRVPASLAPQHVILRYYVDGEPQYHPTEVVAEADGEQWWQGTIPMANPFMHYRWLVIGGDGSYLSVNAEGVHPRDVVDRGDFKLVTAPAPGAWSDNAVVYQIFPDRFARSARADDLETPDWAEPAGWSDSIDRRPHHQGVQFYGGDLWGVIDHLDHIASLGVTTVYFTPIFPGRSNHRYDANTFAHVDEMLGGDEALAALTKACHQRGMTVMGDITTNHTGVAHEWFQQAQADPTAPEREFYLWEPDGQYATWLGVKSLPKLDYHSCELRRRFYEGPDSVIRHWMDEPYNLDGWRVDVANMTGRHVTTDLHDEVARGVRQTMDSTGRDHLLVAEHWHDLADDLRGDGWHGAMHYAGFARPIWEWVRTPGEATGLLWGIIPLPRLDGDQVRATMAEACAQIPWTALTHSFNQLGSHDTTRLRTLVGGDPAMVEAAMGLVFGMPGIPMFPYGDEIGMEGEYGEDGRRPMPWDESSWDHETLDVFTRLAHLRRGLPALSTGGMRWVYSSEDVLAWVRETAGQSVLVAVNRAATISELPTDSLTGFRDGRLVHGDGLRLDGDGLLLDTSAPGTHVWVWENRLPSW